MGVGGSLLNCYDFMELHIYDDDNKNNNKRTTRLFYFVLSQHYFISIFRYRQYIGYSCNMWWSLLQFDELHSEHCYSLVFQCLQ